MGIFSKESGVDVIDLPDLHRRKLINLPEREESSELKQGKFTKDGFFDLSNTKQPIQANQTPQEQNNPQSNNQVTDFLNDFASIGASNPNKTSDNNQINESQTPSRDESESVKDLKWRIENLEFKLEQLIERLNSKNS